MMSGGLAFVMTGAAVSGAAAVALLTLPATDYWPMELRSRQVVCGSYREVVLDDFRAGWYGSHLQAAGERPIHNANYGSVPSRQRSLRFTWLRSFHKPVVVRIDIDSQGLSTLTATELDGAGGYGPGTVARRVVRLLTPEEERRLAAVVSETRVFEQVPVDCGGGLDGAQWIAESADLNGYRYVDRWGPREGPSREFGLYMLSLTGWRLDPIY